MLLLEIPIVKQAVPIQTFNSLYDITVKLESGRIHVYLAVQARCEALLNIFDDSFSFSHAWGCHGEPSLSDQHDDLERFLHRIPLPPQLPIECVLYMYPI